jgi:glycosyltransferase involved in cell wall biosynthesis
MKIIMGVHHFPPRYTGGAEWRAYRTAAALAQRGHTVSVVCVENIQTNAEPGGSWTDEVYENLPVRRLSIQIDTPPDRLGWVYDNPWIGDHLQDWLADQRPDAFHLIGGYLLTASALRAARRLGIPTIVTLTDFWFLCPRIQLLRSDGSLSTLPVNPATCARCLGEEKRRFRLGRQIAPGLMDAYWERQTRQTQAVEQRLAALQQALNETDAIISPSQFLKSVFVQAGVDAQRIIFSRQGRDFSHLEPAQLEKTPADRLRLGYLGQIAEIKGVHILFEAVRRLPGLPLTVKAYGDLVHYPQYAARLRQVAAGDNRLSLVGVYRAQELSQVLQELDVVVMPSQWYENSPNVILEAFAHHTPVIAANLGGMAELVLHGENGLLFKHDDPDDLARQIHRLVEEPGLLPALRAGIRPIRSAAQEIDELIESYQRIAHPL